MCPFTTLQYVLSGSLGTFHHQAEAEQRLLSNGVMEERVFRLANFGRSNRIHFAPVKTWTFEN